MAKTFTVSDELGALIERTAQTQGMEPTAVILEAVELYTRKDAYADERAMTIDEWRGEVAMRLRDAGKPDLADAFGGLSDHDARRWRKNHVYSWKAAANVF